MARFLEVNVEPEVGGTVADLGVRPTELGGWNGGGAPVDLFGAREGRHPGDQ
jgi:hypothetical protein